MYGLEAIHQANGWAMAAAGACIVLSGLAVLSFLISMLPRLTRLFEKQPTPNKSPITTPTEASPQKETAPEKLPEKLEEGAALYAGPHSRFGNGILFG